MGVETIHGNFAAEVSGIDLATPLAAAELDALWQASDAHAVLVFRGQTLSNAQQVAFAENFGGPPEAAFTVSS
mgnify:CR=1 FL=1